MASSPAVSPTVPQLPGHSTAQFESGGGVASGGSRSDEHVLQRASRKVAEAGGLVVGDVEAESADSAADHLYESAYSSHPGSHRHGGPAGPHAPPPPPSYHLNGGYHPLNDGGPRDLYVGGDSGDEDEVAGMVGEFEADGPPGPPPPIYPSNRRRVDMGFPGPPPPHHHHGPREDPDGGAWSDPECFIPQHRYHYHNHRH